MINFAIDCRPQSFDTMVGNKESIKALSEACTKGLLPHTIMLIGKSGCGKTTAMTCLLNHLNVDEMNLHVCDCGTMATMDGMRDLIETLEMAPFGGNDLPVVVVLEEVHRLRTNKRVQESLLYTLEHLRENQYIIATTTNPEDLLTQFLNRFSKYSFGELSKEDLLENLIRPIINQYQFRITKKAADQIYERSNGVPREALQLLYYLYTLPEEDRVLPEDLSIKVSEETDCFDIFKDVLFGKDKSYEHCLHVIQQLKTLELEPEEIRQAWLCMVEPFILKPSSKFVFCNACDLAEVLKDSCVHGGYGVLGKSLWYYFKSR